jgi:hypothetical protein
LETAAFPRSGRKIGAVGAHMGMMMESTEPCARSVLERTRLKLGAEQSIPKR